MRGEESAPTEEDLKRAAFGVLKVLKDNVGERHTLSISQEDEIVIAALKRHGAHLSTHGIDQKHLDPFKLIAWLGCEIINGLERGDGFEHQAGVVLDSIIKSLEEILAFETEKYVCVRSEDKELLKRLLLQELLHNPAHGIGFNGLFIAFHCLRSAYKQVQDQLGQGSA